MLPNQIRIQPAQLLWKINLQHEISGRSIGSVVVIFLRTSQSFCNRRSGEHRTRLGKIERERRKKKRKRNYPKSDASSFRQEVIFLVRFGLTEAHCLRFTVMSGLLLLLCKPVSFMCWMSPEREREQQPVHYKGFFMLRTRQMTPAASLLTAVFNIHIYPRQFMSLRSTQLKLPVDLPQL